MALVISFSATGRSTRALASVVVIRPCSNSAVARFDEDQPLVGRAAAEAGTLLGSRHCFSRFSPAVSGTGVDGLIGWVEYCSSSTRSVLLVLDERVVVVVAYAARAACGSKPGALSLRDRPISTSLALTSSIDFAPKLRMSSRSCSEREMSSPTVWMPSRLRQL